MTLNRAVEDSFGVIRQDGKPVLHRPARSWIVRVSYNPGSGERLPFKELRSLPLPVWKETGNRQKPFDMTEWAEYVLLAVVRMRDEPSSHDLVRIYGTHGAEIVPEYENIPCMATNWSVEDVNKNNYMLFYGPPGYKTHLEDASCFPDVGPRFKLDDVYTRFQKELDVYIESIKAERAAEAETARSSRVDHVGPGEVVDHGSRLNPQGSPDLSTVVEYGRGNRR
ncbi:hypothetical protein IL306_013513 [Fusarium sp. DS 682]|nr:hypothetical protein IL306_013513 [Fusarium sp. DS 682]